MSEIIKFSDFQKRSTNIKSDRIKMAFDDIFTRRQLKAEKYFLGISDCINTYQDSDKIIYFNKFQKKHKTDDVIADIENKITSYRDKIKSKYESIDMFIRKMDDKDKS